MKPKPKVVAKKQSSSLDFDKVELTDKEKVIALTAENLKMQRQIAKDYASRVSLENQVRALQDENKRLHVSAPSLNLSNSTLVRASELIDSLKKT